MDISYKPYFFFDCWLLLSELIGREESKSSTKWAIKIEPSDKFRLVGKPINQLVEYYSSRANNSNQHQWN